MLAAVTSAVIITHSPIWFSTLLTRLFAAAYVRCASSAESEQLFTDRSAYARRGKAD